MRTWGIPPRWAVLSVGISWLLAASLLLGSWLSAKADRHIASARSCAPAEIYTPAACWASLPGVVTRLSSSSVYATAGGRQTAMPLFLSGDVPPSSGTPVEIQFYRGRPIRMDGARLHLLSRDSPATGTADLRFWGLFLLAGPPVLVVASAFGPRRRRP